MDEHDLDQRFASNERHGERLSHEHKRREDRHRNRAGDGEAVELEQETSPFSEQEESDLGDREDDDDDNLRSRSQSRSQSHSHHSHSRSRSHAHSFSPAAAAASISHPTGSQSSALSPSVAPAVADSGIPLSDPNVNAIYRALSPSALFVPAGVSSQSLVAAAAASSSGLPPYPQPQQPHLSSFSTHLMSGASTIVNIATAEGAALTVSGIAMVPEVTLSPALAQALLVSEAQGDGPDVPGNWCVVVAKGTVLLLLVRPLEEIEMCAIGGWLVAIIMRTAVR